MLLVRNVEALSVKTKTTQWILEADLLIHPNVMLLPQKQISHQKSKSVIRFGSRSNPQTRYLPLSTRNTSKMKVITEMISSLIRSGSPTSFCSSIVACDLQHFKPARPQFEPLRRRREVKNLEAPTNDKSIQTQINIHVPQIDASGVQWLQPWSGKDPVIWETAYCCINVHLKTKQS